MAMVSTANTGDGDLWTEVVRALGVRTSGRLSPFRELETRDDAMAMVRDCSVALLLVGLVQVALASLAGVGSATDAAIYMPLAVALYRYTSRVAAVLLLGFALFAVAVVVVAAAWSIDGRSDLLLIATLLWASLRSVEATSFLKRVAARPPAARSAVQEHSSSRVAKRARSRAKWLALGGIAFVAVLFAQFVVPLTRQSAGASPSTVSPSIEIADTPASPAPVVAVVDDARMRFSPPAGFIEPRADQPEIATMAAAFVPAAMELDALFVTASDLETFQRNHKFAPARYVMVQSAKAAPDVPVSADQFRAAKAANGGAGSMQLEHLIGGDATLSQWLQATIRAAGTVVDLDGTHVRSEGVVDESDRSLSVASVVEVPASKATPATSRVVVTSLVLARGRIFVAYTYGSYASSGDLAATSAVAREAVRHLIDENPA
jgi:hypothetical protein